MYVDFFPHHCLISYYRFVCWICCGFVHSDSRVSDKLKAQIWNNEYFELRALLTNTVHESRYQVTLAGTTAEQLPSLYL